MTDPVTFLWAIIGILFLAMLSAAAIRMRKAAAEDRAAEAQRQQQQAELDQQRLEAKTHVKGPDGKVQPKCLYCNEPATEKPFTWKYNDGIWDLIRRRFGAPERRRIERASGTAVACAPHDPLAFEEFRLEDAAYDLDRAKLESSWETRRARFQREGVHERVKEKIELHRVKIKGGGKKPRSSNVVSISKVAP